jgi:hypothetical protein
MLAVVHLLGTKRLLSTNHARYVSANFALAAAGRFMVSAGWVTRQIAPQQGRRVASRGPQVPPSGSRRNDARHVSANFALDAISLRSKNKISEPPIEAGLPTSYSTPLRDWP